MLVVVVDVLLDLGLRDGVKHITSGVVDWVVLGRGRTVMQKSVVLSS